MYVKSHLSRTSVALHVTIATNGHMLIVVVLERLNTGCLPLRKIANGFVQPAYDQSLQLLA